MRSSRRSPAGYRMRRTQHPPDAAPSQHQRRPRRRPQGPRLARSCVARRFRHSGLHRGLTSSSPGQRCRCWSHPEMNRPRHAAEVHGCRPFSGHGLHHGAQGLRKLPGAGIALRRVFGQVLHDGVNCIGTAGLRLRRRWLVAVDLVDDDKVVSPWNGGSPVSSSYSTTAAENRSERANHRAGLWPARAPCSAACPPSRPPGSGCSPRAPGCGPPQIGQLHAPITLDEGCWRVSRRGAPPFAVCACSRASSGSCTTSMAVRTGKQVPASGALEARR